MFFLSPDQLEKARPLFAPLENYLLIHAMLAGISPAIIYVDGLDAPQVALAWVKDKVVLAGAPHIAAALAVQALLAGPFAAQTKAQGWGGFLLYSTPGWQEFINIISPGKQIIPATRLYYRLDARRQEWKTVVPPGLQLRHVDAALLTDTAIQNLDWVMEEMVSERPSIADFLDKSFGYCLVHESQIVAWCMSEYNSGNRCELGIATAEAWQQRGLAKVTATAVICDALQQGITDIGWVCWANNRPSVRTAESLGFTRVDERLVHLLFWEDKPA